VTFGDMLPRMAGARHAPNLEEIPVPSGAVTLAPGVIVPAAALRFRFVRSAGPGGQNVNKRSTKAELRVSLADLPIPPDAAHRLRRIAPSRINDLGELLISADEHRSQLRNREACIDRLRELVALALIRPKPRKKTRPSRSSKERRLEAKSRRSEIKQSRSRPRNHPD